MQGLFGPTAWRWLPNLVFLVFFAAAALRGDIVQALGWLAFLVGGGLNASGIIARSRTLTYVAGSFLILGVVLLVTALVLDFSGQA